MAVCKQLCSLAGPQLSQCRRGRFFRAQEGRGRFLSLVWSHEEDHTCSKCRLAGSGSVRSTDRRDRSPRRPPWSHTAARQGPHSPQGHPSPKSSPLLSPWEWGWETWTLTMKLSGLLWPQIRGQGSCEAVSFPSFPQGVNTTVGEGTGQVPHPLAPVDVQGGAT